MWMKYVAFLPAAVFLAMGCAEGPGEGPRNGLLRPDMSVQAAIETAPNGGTVRLGPGVFHENITVNKEVTLVGAGPARTVLAPARLTQKTPDELNTELAAAFEKAGTEQARQAVRREFQERLGRPVLTVTEAARARIEGVKLTGLGADRPGWTLAPAVVEVEEGHLALRNCVVAGGRDDGVRVTRGSLDLRKSLVAGLWGTGIEVGEGASAHIESCELRNCRYAGARFGKGSAVQVEGCRVSGAAWHGLRYDDASPVVRNNRIFGNARSGIYASGDTEATVTENLFHRNEINGMSCLFHNRDRISGNTFAANEREGLAVLGASRPTVERNVFWRHPVAIVLGAIRSDQAGADSVGEPVLADNLFHENPTVCVEKDWESEGDRERGAVGNNGNVTAEPGFAATEGDDAFRLAPGGAAAARRAGWSNPIPARSPWPLQAEEKAIIPETDTRSYRAWKTPGYVQ